MRLTEYRDDEQANAAYGFAPSGDNVELEITIKLEGDRDTARSISDEIRNLVNQRITEANQHV